MQPIMKNRDDQRGADATEIESAIRNGFGEEDRRPSLRAGGWMKADQNSKVRESLV
jgi:hypothetical protein